MWQTPPVILASVAIVALFVYRTRQLLDFVVTTEVPPAGAERALTRSLEGFAIHVAAAHKMEARPRRFWSPHPAIVASVVESVGGSNIWVRQRPRMFWWCTMFFTLIVFAIAQGWSYALHKPLSDQLFTFSASWIYTWNDRLPKMFAALLLAEGMIVIAGLWHSCRRVSAVSDHSSGGYRGENA